MCASLTRHAHMHLSKLSFLALLPALAGCATVTMMKDLPPDAGRLAWYAAPPETLVAVAEAAIQQQHLTIADTDRDDGARVVIGRRAPGLFSNGEFVRVRIAADSGNRDAMAVRIVSQSGYLLDLAHRDGAPSLFGAMDAQLPGAALGPWPGMRVRATLRDSTDIVGAVMRVIADTIVLDGARGSGPHTLQIGALAGLKVSRGSYGHTRAGALIGVLVGSLVGAAIGSATTDSGDPFSGLNVAGGVFIGALGGGLVGGAVGASSRTEVWSPVPIR